MLIGGCASTPPPYAGFISDYSKLQKIETGRMRYISPELRNYSSYLVDPVQIRVQREQVTPEQRAEVALYMQDALIRVLRAGGYKIVTQPGVGVARFRAAITDIQDAKWYLNIHPASKVTGAGRASASMEGEVIDSVTGAQLAAWVRGGKAREFELNPFSTIDDVKNVIDQWAEAAADRLKEFRGAKN
jgi:hypothetical protein